MKLVIERAELLRAIEPAARVIQRRNLIPILNNIRLVAIGRKLIVTATDLDIEMRASVSADIEEEGAATVPAAVFVDLARKLPEGGQISLSQTDDTTRLTVRAGRSHTRVPTLPADEYPDIIAEDLTHEFNIAAEILAALLRDTVFAASTEATLPQICGVHLHETMQGDVMRLTAVGTDGNRVLARRVAPMPAGAAGMPSITIPTKTVGEITRAVDKVKDEVLIELGPKKIRATMGHICLTSSLIQVPFPVYEPHVTTNAIHLVTVEADSLASALNRIAITIDQNEVRSTTLTFSPQCLTLTAVNQASGDAREEVECDYEGEPFRIGFNHTLLSRIVDAIGGDTVLMKLVDEKSNAQFMTREGSDLLTMLAPLRV